jgi:hypothetical protein
MKRFLFSLVPIALLLCSGSFLKNEKVSPGYEDLWSGYVVFTYTMVDKGDITDGPSRGQHNFTRDATMFINVNNNKGRADVKEVLSLWEKITTTEHNAPPSMQMKKSYATGGGSGDVVVWVEMTPETGTYWLKTDGPSYNIQRVDSFIQVSLGTTIFNSGASYSAEQTGFPVDAPDQPIGNNPNEVKGRYVIISNRTHYVVVSWDLKKTGKSQMQGTRNPKTQNANSNPNSNPNQNSGSNSVPNTVQNSGSNQGRQDHFDFVELIVTPENYSDWLPKEGGDKLRISLEVRGKNSGQPPSRAVGFELALFSTSIGGSTSTATSGAPDIQFLAQPSAVLSNQDQFMSMPCTDGRTGEFFIGSHHSLASTTLVAFAILADGRRIKGNLLKSGGPTEIPIPKTALQ